MEISGHHNHLVENEGKEFLVFEVAALKVMN